MTENKIICKICQLEFETKVLLSRHVKSKHNLKIEDYIIQYFHNGIHPACFLCENETRYSRTEYAFKKYCKEHANEARREWSKNNSKLKFDWKKGLTKETSESVKKHSEKMKGENNPFFNKKHSEESKKKMSESHFLKRPKIGQKKEVKNKYPSEFNNRMYEKKYSKESINKMILSKEKFEKKLKHSEDNFEFLFSYDDYKEQSNVKTLFPIKCKKCGKIQEKNIWSLRYSWCSCIDYKKQSSNEEKQIQDFIKQFENNIECNNKIIISPKELDIYIPDKNFAIEYNGIYWYSNKEKKYHREKTNLCDQKNIQLFHIFSDEWLNKQEIIESMILYRLKTNIKNIYARKCILKEISSKEAKEFFNKSHISGFTPSKTTFGLYYENELACCLSLRKPRHKKYWSFIEIARFANLPFTNVIGGFSKLLKVAKQWSIKNEYKSIYSYADLRFGKGKVYEKNGFKFIGQTNIDYWYTNGKKRFNRFKFRAQNGKTEKQIAEENNVWKIYGCGSNIFELEL